MDTSEIAAALTAEIGRLTAARDALQGKPTASTPSQKKKPTISAAARKAISERMRKRWAEVKRVQRAKSKP